MRTGRDPVEEWDEDSEGAASAGEDNEALLQLSRKRFDRCKRFWEPIYEKYKEDVKFASGDQWSDTAKALREADQRPILTFNKLAKFIRQVTGGLKQSMPVIAVSPVEGDSSKHQNVAGTKDYTTAQVIEGIVRNIEYLSNSKEHYKRSFNHCVSGGIGWLRAEIDYRDSDSFDLDLVGKSVRNPTTVFLDPHCKEPDYSDADYGFVIDAMPKGEYEARYGEVADASEFTYDGGEYNWVNESDGTITIAEYFRRVPTEKTLYLLSDNSVTDKEEAIEGLREKGITVKEERKVVVNEVIRTVINGHTVLEEDVEWPGDVIPLCPVTGPEVIIDDEVIYESLIRHSHDAQRSENYQKSQAIEMVALQPKAPFIAEESAIDGYEDDWENANTSNVSVLVHNTGTNAPKRQPPGNMPVAELQLALAANDDIKATTGIFDAALGNRSNETSGVAINARKAETAESTFEWVDGLQRGLTKLGRVMVKAIPDVYSKAKIQRIRTNIDDEDTIEINTEVEDENGNMVPVHDLSAERYDVKVSMGPAFSTAREETRVALEGVMKAVPDLAMPLMPMYAKMQDWPWAKDMQRVVENIAPAETLSEEQLARREERMAKRKPQEPTPAEQQAMAIEQAKAEAEMKTAEATIAKADADIAEAQARNDADIEGMVQQQVSQSMNEMSEMLKGAVREETAEALAEFIQQNQPTNKPTERRIDE